MNRTFASLIAVIAMNVQAPAPADACGVKLTVKSGARKAVARSSNPSKVLLVGKPPRRLERDLVAAGHRVETVSNPSAAKHKQYAVVITDSSLEPDTRKSFSNSTIVVRSNDVVADIRSVENNVARRPVRVAGGDRVAVAARVERQPVAVGPARDTARKPVGARDTSETVETPVAPTPPPAPRVVEQPRPTPAKVEQPKPEPKVVKADPPKVDPAPKVEPAAPAVDTKPADPPTAVAAKPKSIEIYFTVNDADAGARAAAAVASTAKWMTAHASVNVTIEGHADPSGNPDANLALSQRRAEWVRDQLVAAGIDSSRIEVVAHGDTQLKYGAADGRNRRVFIVPKQ